MWKVKSTNPNAREEDNQQQQQIAWMRKPDEPKKGNKCREPANDRAIK